ncbi:S-type pyocin domain-containing protein [Pseudomonas fragariae (ex Marin et al. 2024)]|uniref:S-type pyocin domain-containing protein n=2 Tax=Pseudomonas fragariae (ex Marin et al. 2024) TaxID=3080056 RepID=A0ABU5BCX3_9PSED|nr:MULTISPECIES: S-type pyocin domain-containing protein [unclassified Pseudomonas]MCW6059047.1 S-type pyocin domain-containing protein [Pseudomonas fragi]MDV0429146.1 S-type pyocin domain-containing protein [Pseudomonas sp. 17]MDX9574786.1 S-type pyocin domain-containing protein [Pseudomonas sp. 21(2023)]MDX9589104.1 S-type pyocin domain-containing protein [Pseudomonas sp. 19(2023)]MDX9626576.1 S-type pyocin domain-containing protein [Pseudomonas sp. 20]
MADEQEKHIYVKYWPIPDLGSADQAAAEAAANKASGGGNSGWSIGIGGGGGGPSTTGLGPGRGRRRGITNKQLRRLLRQQEAEAHALAQRQAAEHAAHLARLEAEAHARAMAEAAERERVEAQVRAQAEKDQAHRQALETLTASYPSLQSGLAQNYLLAFASQPNDLQKEIASGHDLNADPPRDEQALELILQKKIRVNYLLAIKQPLLEERRAQALSLTGQELDHATQKDHLNYLVYYSQGDPPRVQQAHEAWIQALSQTYEAKLLAESVTLLNEQSAALSMRHAELSLANKPASQDARQAAGIDKLWSVIAPASTTTAATGIRTVATNIAKDQLIRIATRTLGSNLVTLLAMYPQPLGDAELPPAVIATPLSQLNLPPHIDLHYLASVKGTLDVPHRLTSDEAGTSGAARWVATDGVEVGTKVRVRTFTYNAQNNSYEFIRDGESTPALIWTPIARPADSSTSSPAGPPALPVDPGNVVTPFVPELEAYPAIDRDDPDDYILISPIDSGLPNSYLLFKDPRSIPGVASGYGERITNTWLDARTRAEGAPIPSQVADQLRGVRFSNFGRQREAIWKAVANDSEISQQFSQRNLQLMKAGNAPHPKLEDQVGQRTKFEIHHKEEIANGGAVYDVDNLVIMTPKQHIEHHRNRSQ